MTGVIFARNSEVSTGRAVSFNRVKRWIWGSLEWSCWRVPLMQLVVKTGWLTSDTTSLTLVLMISYQPTHVLSWPPTTSGQKGRVIMILLLSVAWQFVAQYHGHVCQCLGWCIIASLLYVYQGQLLYAWHYIIVDHLLSCSLWIELSAMCLSVCHDL